jgi:hypothetical protein
MRTERRGETHRHVLITFRYHLTRKFSHANIDKWKSFCDRIRNSNGVIQGKKQSSSYQFQKERKVISGNLKPELSKRQ